VTDFNLGGKRIEVRAKSRYYYFYRRQGLSIRVSPETHWWCLWLCSDTTKVDSIRCSAVLTGTTVGDFEPSGSCSDCGSLTLWGPTMWGVGVPQAYQTVRYSGSVVIDGQGYELSGIEFFGTPP
jgi:hypothetical protein